jgi:uncharacterized protein with GYD domain
MGRIYLDWTTQGVEPAEHNVKRFEHGNEIAESFGCKIEHAWWTQGHTTCAPDEQAMVAYTVAVVRLGNFPTTTAWSANEMHEIVGRLPQWPCPQVVQRPGRPGLPGSATDDGLELVKRTPGGCRSPVVRTHPW